MIRFNDILEKVNPYLTNEDIADVTKAYAYSAKVHAGQKRYSGEPYMIHPMEVTSILADIRLDKESIITGLLHHTIEDTLATKEDISRIFDENITIKPKNPLNYQCDSALSNKGGLHVSAMTKLYLIQI